MSVKIAKLLSILCIYAILCVTLIAEEETEKKVEEQKTAIQVIRAKLKEFGWRVLYYESEDKELWGNRGIGPKGYIVGAPPGVEKEEKREERIVVQPKMLSEEELQSLRDEISQTISRVELGKEERRELEHYLSQIENQLKAYKEQFETLGGMTYTIKKGDSLWSIARDHYGDAYKWPIIYRANKDKIDNPNLIYPGQHLSIPAIKVRK
ncbi:MAG TPA: LysM peptidoglycan-binding domain-containing protein [Candidatus Omnitrophica bacterium]|nr:LysM peptidoglycan-binding domain-containing protein [Candidatus Omnitrophota bacterium]